MSNNLKDHGEWLNNLPEKYNLDGKELISTEEVMDFQDFYRSRYIFYIQQQARMSLDEEDTALRGVGYGSSEAGRQFCESVYRRLEDMFKNAEENERLLRLSKENQGDEKNAEKENNPAANDKNNNQIANDENINSIVNDENNPAANDENNSPVANDGSYTDDANVPSTTDDVSESMAQIHISIVGEGESGDDEGDSDIQDKKKNPMEGFVCINDFSDDNNPIYDFAEVQEFEIGEDEWFLQQPKIYQYVLMFANALQTQLKQQDLLSQIIEEGLELQESEIVILKYVYENPVINSRYMRSISPFAFEDHHFQGAYENVKTDFTQTWPAVEVNAQSSAYDKIKAELFDLQFKVQPVLITLQTFELQMNVSYKQIQCSDLLNTLVQIRERYFYFYMVKEVSILEDPKYRRCTECQDIGNIIESCETRYDEVDYLIKKYDGLFKELHA